MAHVVLQRSFTPPLPGPITDAAWMELHHNLDPCLEARGAQWIRSLVALDGCRSVCEFEVPYAEAVRAACREARMPFETVWRAEIWPGPDANAWRSCPTPIVAEVQYVPPMTQERWEMVCQQAGPCFQELEIRRFFSLMYPDRQQSVCLFAAPSAEAVRTAFRRNGFSFIHVWQAQLIAPPVP
jgi:hypothetical protein